MSSTSKPPAPKSWAASVASQKQETIEAFVDGLSPEALAALPYLFEFWGMRGHQLPPKGRWRTWLILGGRGAGKTRAGAEWVRTQVEGPTPDAPGQRRRIALIAHTIEQAVEVMIRGDSGLLACAPADRRPDYIASRKTLVWPNGAEATCFSASSPEALRGPQFDGAWADELGKWPKAKATWDMLQMALRLGDDPKQIVTTTPRANPVLEALVEDDAVMVTSAPTSANSANLAKQFLSEVYDTYGATTLGRQELYGEMILDRPGALWTRQLIDGLRARSGPEMKRIVVAVDPPVTSGDAADECGIIVAGLGADEHAYVLADKSSQGDTPLAWAARAVEAYHAHEADRIVAEVNQGGEMVKALIHQTDNTVAFRAVRATQGKRTRAEPISALYERGLVHHLGGFSDLEDQMCAFGTEGPGCRSPDRVDALVWALTDLMLPRGSQLRVRKL
ncbi:MAG: DNA-packaging protein [Pikeienuella sp.]